MIAIFLFGACLGGSIMFVAGVAYGVSKERDRFVSYLRSRQRETRLVRNEPRWS